MSEFDDLDNQDIEQVETPEQDYDDLPDDLPDEPADDLDDTPATEDDELGFSFDESEEGEHGDPFKGQPAPDWVKHTRNRNKELEKENRQLKQTLEKNNPQSQQAALRDKPTLAAYDYDEAAYEADLQHWYGEKAQHDEVVRKEQEKHQKIDDKYRASVDSVRRIAKDYDEVEQQVIDILPEQQQALLKMGASDPAKLAYALGKSPNKLAELSQLEPIEFIKQIALMEYQMSNKTRNPNKPQPKTHELKGMAGGTDSTLAKLEAEAEKTGDRSKIAAYKKQQRMKK